MLIPHLGYVVLILRCHTSTWPVCSLCTITPSYSLFCPLYSSASLTHYQASGSYVYTRIHLAWLRILAVELFFLSIPLNHMGFLRPAEPRIIVMVDITGPFDPSTFAPTIRFRAKYPSCIEFNFVTLSSMYIHSFFHY